MGPQAMNNIVLSKGNSGVKRDPPKWEKANTQCLECTKSSNLHTKTHNLISKRVDKADSSQKYNVRVIGQYPTTLKEYMLNLHADPNSQRSEWLALMEGANKFWEDVRWGKGSPYLLVGK